MELSSHQVDYPMTILARCDTSAGMEAVAVTAPAVKDFEVNVATGYSTDDIAPGTSSELEPTGM